MLLEVPGDWIQKIQNTVHPHPCNSVLKYSWSLKQTSAQCKIFLEGNIACKCCRNIAHFVRGVERVKRCVRPFALHRQQPDKDMQNVDFFPPWKNLYILKFRKSLKGDPLFVFSWPGGETRTPVPPSVTPLCSIHGHWMNCRSAPWARAFTTIAPRPPENRKDF